MADVRYILVVDDDQQIGQLVGDYLHQHGYQVCLAKNGKEMWRMFDAKPIALVVLDVMLPGDDGLTLCRQLREKSAVPIIMLSAMGEEVDRVLGLEVGADDYLTKPFGARELLARIKALLRRSAGDLGQKRAASGLVNLPLLHFSDWTLDRKRRVLVTNDQVTVPLRAGEYDLLVVFLEHPGRVLSRDQLMDLTRGAQAAAFDRSIDVQVARLRKKIEKDPSHPELIITVRGGGYQLQAKVSTGR